jgi:hypothetical protein
MFKFESTIVRPFTSARRRDVNSFRGLSLLKVLKLLRSNPRIAKKESSLFPFIPPPLLSLGDHDVHVGGSKILLKVPFLQLHLPFSLTVDGS